MSSHHETSENVVIKQADFIESVADALQYISYYHPKDFVDAMSEAYEREQSAAAKDAIAQILINSRMSAEGKRPLCQDTGIVTTFVKIGMGVKWDKTDMTVQQMVDEGVRRAYTNPDNPLRASIVADPAGSRKTPKTTPHPWCISIWCQATMWKWLLLPKVAAVKTKPRW